MLLSCAKYAAGTEGTIERLATIQVAAQLRQCAGLGRQCPQNQWRRRIFGAQAIEQTRTTCRIAGQQGVAQFVDVETRDIEHRFFHLRQRELAFREEQCQLLNFLVRRQQIAFDVTGDELQRSLWRWLALFLPLCGGMYFAQRQTFPETPHLEWPGSVPANDWLQTFAWIRENTPQDAYFALDPDHMNLPGEDEHGFRALAERSMLADRVKDSSAVTLFPRIAEDWKRQVSAAAGWNDFQKPDFERLRQQFGVTWFVVQRAGGAGLNCVYENQTLKVCRLV